jgi:hypothetical protein
MISGDANRRAYDVPDPYLQKSLWTTSDKAQSVLLQNAIGWNCLNYNKPPLGSLTQHIFPNRSTMDTCIDGIRGELAFPSCGNGKPFDPKNPFAHVAYSSLVLDGDCPDGYDIRYPTLFIEMIWQVSKFTGQEGEFLLSNNDNTGELTATIQLFS